MNQKFHKTNNNNIIVVKKLDATNSSIDSISKDISNNSLKTPQIQTISENNKINNQIHKNIQIGGASPNTNKLSILNRRLFSDKLYYFFGNENPL